MDYSKIPKIRYTLERSEPMFFNILEYDEKTKIGKVGRKIVKVEEPKEENVGIKVKIETCT